MNVWVNIWFWVAGALGVVTGVLLTLFLFGAFVHVFFNELQRRLPELSGIFFRKKKEFIVDMAVEGRTLSGSEIKH